MFFFVQQHINSLLDQPVERDSYCTSMDMSAGRWYSRPCNTRKPYICKVPGTNSCPPSNACPTTNCPTFTQPQCPSCPHVTCASTTCPAPSCPAVTCPAPSCPPTRCPVACPSGWTYVAEAEGKCLRVCSTKKDGWFMSCPDD